MELTQEVFKGKDINILSACVDQQGVLRFGDSTSIEYLNILAIWVGAEWLEEISGTSYTRGTSLLRKFNEQVHNAYVENKISSFSTYRRGWNSGEGRQFSEKVIQVSKNLVFALEKLGFNIFNTYPGNKGDIALIAETKENTFEFVVGNDSKIDCFIGDLDKSTFSELLIDDLIVELQKLLD